MILAAMSMAIIAMAVTQFTKRIDRKPFNCEFCMTFWLSLIVSLLALIEILLNASRYILDLITFMGISIFTRQLLYKVWRTMF